MKPCPSTTSAALGRTSTPPATQRAVSWLRSTPMLRPSFLGPGRQTRPCEFSRGSSEATRYAGHPAGARGLTTARVEESDDPVLWACGGPTSAVQCPGPRQQRPRDGRGGAPRGTLVNGLHDRAGAGLRARPFRAVPREPVPPRLGELAAEGPRP